MKKIHLVLIIVAAITAITSVYSLAAMNQTYKISFEWFSEYNNKYSFEKRDTSRDKWQLNKPYSNMVVKVISDELIYQELINEETISNDPSFYTDLSQYILVYCSFGEVLSPEYRIKVSDIAQRGDVVEIVISTNSPAKQSENAKEDKFSYYPRDIIRIDKNALPIKGKLLFIFKDQDGAAIEEQYCDIKIN